MAYKGETRSRGPDAGQEVGDGHSTDERWDNQREGRAVTFTMRLKRRKAIGMHPRGQARTRQRSPSSKRKYPQPMGSARKLQRTLYRTAKKQPGRRFTKLYDKVYRQDVLDEAWRRVKENGGAAGVDKMDMDDVKEYGEERFLAEIQEELKAGTYRSEHVRRVHIPKPGQPGKTRPLGIPTTKVRDAPLT